MDRDGHFGFTLLVWFTVAWTMGIYTLDVYLLGVLSSVLSFIPDIDLKLRIKHRGVTHSLVTSLVTSIGAGVLTMHTGLGFWTGFTVLFAAQSTHILGDIFTYTPLKPFYPLSGWSISLKLFRSDNNVVNKIFLYLGGITSTAYLLKTWGIDIFELLFS